MKKLLLMGISLILFLPLGCAKAQKKVTPPPEAAAPTDTSGFQLSDQPKSDRERRKQERRREKMQSVFYNR